MLCLQQLSKRMRTLGNKDQKRLMSLDSRMRGLMCHEPLWRIVEVFVQSHSVLSGQWLGMDRTSWRARPVVGLTTTTFLLADAWDIKTH